jgi:hypothetical protein
LRKVIRAENGEEANSARVFVSTRTAP